ncbi:MAG: sulfur carrier protein ThiS [Rhodothermales bacterium]
MNATQTASTIFVNGETRPLPHPGTTLEQFLKTMDVDAQTSGIAVAVNDEVIRRQAWAGTTLEANDHIEIVTAKQGG